MIMMMMVVVVIAVQTFASSPSVHTRASCCEMALPS